MYPKSSYISYIFVSDTEQPKDKQDSTKSNETGKSNGTKF